MVLNCEPDVAKGAFCEISKSEAAPFNLCGGASSAGPWPAARQSGDMKGDDRRWEVFLLKRK